MLKIFIFKTVKQKKKHLQQERKTKKFILTTSDGIEPHFLVSFTPYIVDLEHHQIKQNTIR